MTRNFSLDEFVASSTAVAKGISNNLPSILEANALRALDMMQKIRDHLSAIKGRDIPVTITSGYRSPALNRAVGGVPSSDHVLACAVDFRAPDFGSPLQIATELSGYVQELGIGQLINEHPEQGNQGWVHVSCKPQTLSANRIITITAKGTTSGVHAA